MKDESSIKIKLDDPMTYVHTRRLHKMGDG